MTSSRHVGSEHGRCPVIKNPMPPWLFLRQLEAVEISQSDVASVLSKTAVGNGPY